MNATKTTCSPSSAGPSAPPPQAARTLVGMIDERRSRYTAHSANVARLAHAVGTRLGMDLEALEDLRMAALVHDIGMLKIDAIRSGSRWDLAPEERREFETHPRVGADMAEFLGLSERVCETVLHHHERCDGTGYPFGLARDDIPAAARMLAVCDTFDQMTHGRNEIEPVPMDEREALEYLRFEAAGEYDADAVRALAEVLELEQAMAELAELAH